MNDDEYKRHLTAFANLLPLKHKRWQTVNRQRVLNIEDWDLSNHSLIELIYEVRCNLFHGRKNPEDKDNRDFRLVRLAFLLLAPLVIQYARQRVFIDFYVLDPETFEVADLEDGIFFD